MASPIMFGIVSSFHDLFSAVWIGGLIIMALIVLPLLKQQMMASKKQENGSKPVMGKVNPLMAFQKRLQIAVWISMIGLLITGLLLSRAAKLSPVPVTSTYSTLLLIKHVIYGVMIAVGLLRGRLLQSSLSNSNPKTQKLAYLLVYINFGLGIITIFLSGILPVIKF
ncbi:MAG: CopD family protein [Candidatus Lokiarchaeota archaeon]|nr:CopD family protein [Candidatus Harpocratesius repetitus]